MKKLIAVLLIFIIVFSFIACKTKKAGSSGADGDETTSQSAESATGSSQSSSVTTVKVTTKTVTFSSKSVDYESAIKKLNSKQEKFVEDLGVTEQDKKIVGYFDNDDETQVMVCELKDGLVNKVYNYRFYKNEEIYKGMTNLENVNDPVYTVYKDEKCIRIEESRKYRGQSFTEMLETLNGYDIKY
ncbi:MAG: hypothetical protein IJU45_09605 [Clostridia bacterium]|nr:hypothetical protein [Clostridia bacterium]